VRLLAALALVAAVVAVVVVVTNSIDGKDGGGKKKEKREDAEIAGCEPEFENAKEAGFYIVQQDDLLSLIAQRTCVEDEELTRLNPDVDPQALAPGQCISLEEKGCEKSGT
jgi:LysM repeat protein